MSISLTMQQTDFNQQLLGFIDSAPSPFHAVSRMSAMLSEQGFQRLREADDWQLDQGGKYFVTRNDSALIAFVYGSDEPVSAGLKLLGAHTDSPCLRVKPNPELELSGYFSLGVEVYGGALLNPWFDRDLSLAGRVSYLNSTQQLASALIDFGRPIATIPSLAIHLDREANNTRSINAQKDIPPVLALVPASGLPDFRDLLRHELDKQSPGLAVEKVLDYELSFYDCQPAAMLGLEEDFIAAARLDNLLSCFVGVQAMLTAGSRQSTFLVCNDHEEVGSASTVGAQGPMLRSVLERLYPDAARLARIIDRSLMVSMDNAHGIHPNYADKHDARHGPRLNKGPVLKINANQRYASNSEGLAVIRHLCEGQGVPLQSFVVRTDMACGSTIGPITATEIGVNTVDIGVPTFAMHSCRELAGRDDAWHLYRAMSALLQGG